MSRAKGVIHEPDEPAGLIQKCIRCGFVLEDYRNTMGEGNFKPAWWNKTVTVYPGNPQVTVVGSREDAVKCEVAE